MPAGTRHVLIVHLAIAVFVDITEDIQVLAAVSFCKRVKTVNEKSIGKTAVGIPCRELAVLAPGTENRDFVTALFIGVVGVPIDNTIAVGGPVSIAFGISNFPTEQAEGGMDSTIVVNGDAV